MPADIRRSFDGLAGMTATIIEQHPLSGHLFVFRNRNRDRVKIPCCYRDRLVIWYTRLERGTFQQRETIETHELKILDLL